MTARANRNTMFYGEKNQARVQSAFVVVVGLGGVGSHAAHMLARSGVGRLRLVDFDQVTLSSLNRHAVATRDDVGRPKVSVCAERFADFNPVCEVEAVPTMFTAADADALLAGNPTYVIDCIDDISTKADLLQACKRLKLPVISALGAGGKVDPTRILIGHLADAVKDPLACKLRYELRIRSDKDAAEGGGADVPGGATATGDYLEGIHVVYSYEKSRVKLASLDKDQESNPEKYGSVPNFRIRTMPVVGYMPALFGMMAAGYVTSALGNKKFEPKRVEMISDSFRKKLRRHLLQREKGVFSNVPGDGERSTPVADEAEITYVVEDVWGNRSCFNSARTEFKGLTLTRFDRSKPALPYNLVFVTPAEAKAHDAATAETGALPAGLASSPQLLAVQQTLAAIEAAWA